MSEDSQFRFLDDHRAWVLELPAFETNNEREFSRVPGLEVVNWMNE